MSDSSFELSVPLLREHETAASKPEFVVPSENWSAETITWMREKVNQKGGIYAHPLVETYALAVTGVFGPIMARYRKLLLKCLNQDAARDRLMKRLIQSGLPLIYHKENLTPTEVIHMLNAFRWDEEKKLEKDNALSWRAGFFIAVLETAVAWPFFSSVLLNSGFTGLIPTVAGFIIAFCATVATTAIIWWWYRSLFDLFKDRSLSAPSGAEPLGSASKKAAHADSLHLLNLRRSLHRENQTPVIVTGILFVLLSVALAYIWKMWCACDQLSLLNAGASERMAETMGPVLASLLMLGSFSCVKLKEGVAQGLRRISNVTNSLREWMADELADLYKYEVSDDDYNRTCTLHAWASQRILRIGVLVLWKDISQEQVATEICNQILAIKEDAFNDGAALEFA